MEGCIETMIITNNKVPILQYHLDRFLRSRMTLLPDFPHSEELLTNAIAPYLQEEKIVLRCSWQVKYPELVKLEMRELPDRKTPYSLSLFPQPIPPNPHSWIKSIDRSFYDKASNFAKEQNTSDALIINEENRIVESTIANILVEKEGKWFTPPLSEGCVAGVFRDLILRKPPLFKNETIEQTIDLSMLKAADKIYLCNAVRGIFEAQLIE